MATALEQSFADLAAKHGLLSVSLTFHGGSHFCASLQWHDASVERQRGCSMEHGDTVAEALGKAVASMIAARSTAEPFRSVTKLSRLERRHDDHPHSRA